MATLMLDVSDRALRPESRDFLARLGERPWSQDFYLAGSAGLASYLEHREVRDLDLMTAANRLRSPERRDLLQDLLKVDPQTQVETARDGFLYARLGNAVALRLFYYPYPLIDPEEELHGVGLASALDLGLMKLGAIISRASRRDFVDLYCLCQRLPLVDILSRSPEKFGHVRDFPLQALKGLADLTLIEGEPMPRLRQALTWVQVESWLAHDARQVARRFVGLEED